MLWFWIVYSDEIIEFEDGAIKDPPDRQPDFLIDIRPFHRILDNGLKQLASEVGLSFNSDVLLEVESCEKILNVLLKIDAELNPAGNQTENRDMAEFFNEAISRNLRVVAYCE